MGCLSERQSFSASQTAEPQVVAGRSRRSLDKHGSGPVPIRSRTLPTLLANKRTRMLAAYIAAGAAGFPRRAMAATMTPMIEPTITVQPIHKVIWGSTAS